MEHATQASRVLMGDSLGFHIIFVLFGLTLPILVSWFEFMGIRRRDAKLTNVAKFWSKIMALLVITGVISGTVIALQMSLVWPGILKFGGDVIGLPFMFETYAFLIEAVFLALYMTTWNKVSPIVHWLFGLGIIVGSTASAFAITSVNAWMNLPTGFTIVDGAFHNVDVWKAMFSETSIIEFVHSMPAYYVAAALAMAGLYAFKIARSKSKDHTLDWFIVHRLMLFVCAAFIATVITADLTGKYLAKHEPAKLATIEIVEQTKSNAPFVFGGFKNAEGKTVGPYIQIPDALSLLVGGSASSEVTGLNEIPKNERPPAVIRLLFNVKLTLIIGLTAMIVFYFAIKYLRPRWLANRPLLISSSIVGFVGIVIVELGWMITEIGRQPWAVRGYVTTSQAITKTHDITTFGYVFPLAFVLLFGVTILAIRKIIKDDAAGGRLSR